MNLYREVFAYALLCLLTLYVVGVAGSNWLQDRQKKARRCG